MNDLRGLTITGVFGWRAGEFDPYAAIPKYVKAYGGPREGMTNTVMSKDIVSPETVMRRSTTVLEDGILVRK